MDFELLPLTEPGKRMVELGEQHAEDFATRVAEHDRDGTFALENVQAMKKSGFSAGPVPQELGGLGVTSVYDSIVVMNRLGRSDPATALAFNMHLNRVMGMARAFRNAIAAGNEARQLKLEPILRKIGAGEIIVAVANSERGADMRTSQTLATRVEGGWLFNGSKRFATGSTAADLLSLRAQYENEAGERRLAVALVPTNRPGLKIIENWDGMGMRASGSHDVVLKDCFIKDEEFDDIGQYGRFNAQFLAANGVTLGLASIFLGIAETAQKMVVNSIRTQNQAEATSKHQAHYPMNQINAAENEIELAASRGILGRAAQTHDDFYHTGLNVGPSPRVSDDQAFEIIKNTACAKKFVMERAVGIVDRALTLSGGAGFVNGNALSRLYRDVRAGPFMQPWASSQAMELIGKVTMGIDPNQD